MRSPVNTGAAPSSIQPGVLDGIARIRAQSGEIVESPLPAARSGAQGPAGDFAAAPEDWAADGQQLAAHAAHGAARGVTAAETCQRCGADLPPREGTGRPRKWCGRRCERDHTRPTRGRPRDTARLDLIAAMWREGRTGSDIAHELGSTPKAVSEAVRAMRAEGVDLPRRRPGRPRTRLDETGQDPTCDRRY